MSPTRAIAPLLLAAALAALAATAASAAPLAIGDLVVTDQFTAPTPAVFRIDPVTGAPVTADHLPLHLRKARLTRVSIEANSGICRGMLRHRYDDTRGQGETAPAGDSPEH